MKTIITAGSLEALALEALAVVALVDDEMIISRVSDADYW